MPDLSAGVSDRGLRHERNEDAVFVAADGPRAVAVVCDGVSLSAAPHVASQVAAQAAGEWLLQVVRGAVRRTASASRRWPKDSVAAATPSPACRG